MEVNRAIVTGNYTYISFVTGRALIFMCKEQSTETANLKMEE